MINYINKLKLRISMKRVLVSLPDGIWKIIEAELKDKLGGKDSEIIRNIVIAYMSENGYLKKHREEK